MFESYRVLDVRQSGEHSLVGLKSDRVSDETVTARLFDEVDRFLRGGRCDVLTMDLAGIEALPSSFVGRLVDLRRRVNVKLINVSDYVQLVLETSQLSRLFGLDEQGTAP